MPNQAMMRTFGLHVASVAAGALAAGTFTASHSVDLYGIYNQLNVVVADITKLLALVAPIASGGYAIYKATTKQVLCDAVSDPKSVEVAKEIPPTPKVVAVAEALKKEA